MNDIRLRSRMMDVEAASVRLELTASQVRLDMRSLLLRRVITSSLRTIPCGVTVQESSMLTPSLIQRKKGRGLPVDIMTSQETETEYKSQNTMTCREPEMKQKVSRFPVWTLLFHNRTAWLLWSRRPKDEKQALISLVSWVWLERQDEGVRRVSNPCTQQHRGWHIKPCSLSQNKWPGKEMRQVKTPFTIFLRWK